MARFTAAVVVSGCMLAALPQGAQELNAQEPRTFEVASIKLSVEGGSTYQRASPNGTLSLGSNTLRNMVRFAYGLQGSQVVGGPEWLDSDRFDVVAKATRPFTTDEGRAMLRALLAERFGLVAHAETRPMAVYLMRRASADRLGPRLRRSSANCDTTPCVLDVRLGGGSIAGVGVSLAQLARNLMNAVGRTIVDETGLSGAYDLDLAFAPEGAGADSPAPSVFTALQEQLGLKLEPGREPIDVLVIDRAVRPSAD